MEKYNVMTDARPRRHASDGQTCQCTVTRGTRITCQPFVCLTVSPPPFRPHHSISPTAVQATPARPQGAHVGNSAKPTGCTAAERCQGIHQHRHRRMLARPPCTMAAGSCYRRGTLRAQRAFASRSCTMVIEPFSTIHFSLEISAVKASFSETVTTAPLKSLSALVSAATESLSR